jgi:hypothetical protein
MLLKVALNTINQAKPAFNMLVPPHRKCQRVINNEITLLQTNSRNQSIKKKHLK